MKNVEKIPRWGLHIPHTQFKCLLTALIFFAHIKITLIFSQIRCKVGEPIQFAKYRA